MGVLAGLLIACEVVLLAVFVLTRAAGTRELGWRLHEALLGWQTLYWLGASILFVVAPSRDTTSLAFIASVAQLSLTAGVLVATGTARAPEPAPSELRPTERKVTYAIAAAAAAVCLLFIVIVVRNEELALLLAGVLTGDEQFLEFRTTMTSGGAVYLAPGYVKQFRDVLLPTALIALVAFTTRPRWLVIVPMGLIGLAAAILSGERFSVMLYVLALGAAFMMRPDRGAVTARLVAPLLALVLFSAFVGTTILLGRASEDTSAFGIVIESASSLIDRVVLTLPRENAGGYAVWSPLAPSWGANWTSAIAGILPGSQTGLDQELHEVLGGSALGSSPLGLPADAYLAWGMLGIAICPFVYCVLLARTDEVLLDARLAVARAFRVALVPLSFAWYSPFLFVLNGGVVLLAAAAAGLVLMRRR